MKKPILLLVAASLLATITACTTFDSRIKENQEAFDKLSPADQQVVRSGFIKVGFTQEMVYMALDKPEKKLPGSGAGNETWIYHNFYSSDGGGMGMGQKVKTNFAPGSGGTAGSSRNPTAGGRSSNNTFNVEADPAAENIKADAAIKVHVKFIDGKVATIEIIRPH